MHLNTQTTLITAARLGPQQTLQSIHKSLPKYTKIKRKTTKDRFKTPWIPRSVLVMRNQHAKKKVTRKPEENKIKSLANTKADVIENKSQQNKSKPVQLVSLFNKIREILRQLKMAAHTKTRKFHLS